MDIAVLFKTKDNYRYVLLLVDVFSSKVFTEPLKSRKIEEVLKALKKIVANFNSKIYEIQSDQEAAFLSKEFKAYFKNENIVFRPKFGKNKAAIGKLNDFKTS